MEPLEALYFVVCFGTRGNCDCDQPSVVGIPIESCSCVERSKAPGLSRHLSIVRQHTSHV